MQPGTDVSERIYSYLWEKLFFPGTNLFYDRIRPGEDPLGDLPSPEEISKQFPNPCGWGTGMEDCAINAGHMLLTLVQIHCQTGADITTQTEALLKGLRLCESVHGNKGFLVRGVSHRDRKSCYFNSSRDQLTMAAAGLWDLWQKLPELPEEQRDLIALILEEIAEYCLKNVTAENNYSYRRLDGGKAVVSELWDCAVHEMLRLPMIYAAAGEVCGSVKFTRAAQALMDEGLSVSEKFDKNKYYWDFPLVQMQLSLDVLSRIPSMAFLHERIEKLMGQVGFAACREFCSILSACEKYQGAWDVFTPNWRTLPMKVTPMTLKADPGNVVFDSYTYLNPVYPTEFMTIVEYQRSLGNYLTAALLPEKHLVQTKDYRRFLDFIQAQDFSACTHAGPFSILHGLWLGKRHFPGLDFLSSTP